WLTSRFGPQPARAPFDPPAPSKPLIRTTGAPRLRTSSTPIRWRRSYARSWPTKRNGREARPIFCRSAPTGLAGQRIPGRSLGGCAGRRASSAHSGLKLCSAARGGWECAPSGSWPRVRTDSITSSAPSAASATMEMTRAQTILGLNWNRSFNCADMLTILTQRAEPIRPLEPVDERLDAMIDKFLKRLLHLRRSRLRAVDLESRQMRLRHGGAEAYE